MDGVCWTDTGVTKISHFDLANIEVHAGMDLRIEDEWFINVSQLLAHVHTRLLCFSYFCLFLFFS